MVQLYECTSFAQIVEKIGDFIRDRKIPAGAWVCAVGYDHNRLEEKAHPDKKVLDVFLKNPVAVTHQSGHMGAVNSLALKKLHITSQTPDPEGGISAGNPTVLLAGIWKKQLTAW